MATAKKKAKVAAKRGKAAAPAATKRRTGGTADGRRPTRKAVVPQMELQTLRKLMLLQKGKQALLSARQIGPAEVDSLLSDYLKVILNLTNTAAGSILIHEDNLLVFRACIGPGSRQLIKKTMPEDEGIAGWVYRNGKTYHSPDVSRDARWSGTVAAALRFPTRSILAAPLRTAERTLGVVELINKQDDTPFNRDDQETLETLAGQLALDVAYAGLLDKSIRESRHRASQIALSMVLNSSLDQRQVRTQAIEAVTSLLDAEVGSLLLVDRKTKDLYFEVALGEQGERVKQMRLKMGEGIAGWVAANDQPALINDVQNDPRYFRRAQTLTDFVTRNMVCVPVRSKGGVIGVLQALNRKGGGNFTGEDLENCLMLSNQVAVALENAHLYHELKETFLNTAEALAAAVEKRDPYTGGHIKRVVEYSMAIAQYMDPPLADMEDLRLAAVLHDIGKIGIKDSVLLKEARLDHDEVAHMREHPLVGEDILVHIEQMKGVRKILRAHHEKWDGTGYPDGLSGEDIPVHARIIAIADTFDAITTDRPYRKAADWKTAVEEIKRCSGTDYDPALVATFMRACDAGAVTIVNNR